MSDRKTADTAVSVRESLTIRLREVQLLSRMLLLCSAFEGFSLSANDVQILVSWLIAYCEKVQKILPEVKS